jgi:hypothetical protein
MKTIKFNRVLMLTQAVTITIKNEEDFKDAILECSSNGHSFDFSDLENDLFKSIVKIKFSEPSIDHVDDEDFMEAIEIVFDIDQDWLEEAKNNHTY